MSSSFTINYSLRQNKALERALVFEGLASAKPFLSDDCIYVGLGSVWFQDFQLARRILGIVDMVSMESDPVVYSRAQFNKPFGSVEVLEGDSQQLIREVIGRAEYEDRAYIVWLDYDDIMDEERLAELSWLSRNLPAGSALLTTFSATGRRYARRPEARLEVLMDLFSADIVGEIGSTSEVKDEALMGALADCTLRYLTSRSVTSGRNVAFLSAFRLLYRDSSPMVTVGGLIVDDDVRDDTQSLVSSASWCGIETEVIASQPLTLREMQSLNQLLPRAEPLTLADIQDLGFELSDSQISIYERHHLRYPMYAELR